MVNYWVQIGRKQKNLVVCESIYNPISLSRGYKRFFRRTVLEVSDFLKDDCLKINCTVGVVVNTMDTYRPHSIQVPEPDIGSHFGTLLDNQDGADVVFNVGGERFHAHKLVMAARSTVFRNKFFEEASGSEEEIVIDEMDPKVFKVWSLLFNFVFFIDLLLTIYNYTHHFKYLVRHPTSVELYTDFFFLNKHQKSLHL